MDDGWEDTHFEGEESENEDFPEPASPRREVKKDKIEPARHGKDAFTQASEDVLSKHLFPFLGHQDMTRFLQTSKAGKATTGKQSKHCESECKKFGQGTFPLSILESTNCAGFCVYHRCSEILSLFVALLTAKEWAVQDPSGKITPMVLKQLTLTVTPHKKDPTTYKVKAALQELQ
jgi:hypothetical protein